MPVSNNNAALALACDLDAIAGLILAAYIRAAGSSTAAAAGAICI